MRSRPSGFTLIELMVSVAIVGLLSSVAVPTFRNLQLRSRQAERTMVLESIHRAVEDYAVRESKFPVDLGGGSSFLNVLTWNPNTSPGSQKRPWRRTPVGDWNKLSFTIDGGVYYSYWGYGFVEPIAGTRRYYYLYAVGDLDGDGQRDTVRNLYWYQNDRMVMTALATRDGQVSEQLETPAGGGTF